MFQNFAWCTILAHHLRRLQLSYHVTSRACSLETSFGCMEIHLSTFMMIQNLVSNLYQNPCNAVFFTHFLFELISTQEERLFPLGKSPFQVNNLSNYIDDVTKIQHCAIFQSLLKSLIFLYKKACLCVRSPLFTLSQSKASKKFYLCKKIFYCGIVQSCNGK